MVGISSGFCKIFIKVGGITEISPTSQYRYPDRNFDTYKQRHEKTKWLVGRQGLRSALVLEFLQDFTVMFLEVGGITEISPSTQC